MKTAPLFPRSTPRKSLSSVLMGASSFVKKKPWFRALQSNIRRKSQDVSENVFHSTPSYYPVCMPMSVRQSSAVEVDSSEEEFHSFESPRFEVTENDLYLTCNEMAFDQAMDNHHTQTLHGPASAKKIRKVEVSHHAKFTSPQKVSSEVEIVMVPGNEDHHVSPGQLVFSEVDNVSDHESEHVCSDAESDSDSFHNVPLLVPAENIEQDLTSANNSMNVPSGTVDAILDHGENEETFFHAFTDLHNAIIILRHPSETVLLGDSSVRVLAGAISLFGHHLDSSNREPVPVFSSNYDFYTIVTKEPISIPPSSIEEYLLTALEEIGSVGLVDEILPHLTNCSVILAMSTILRTCAVEYVHSLMGKHPHKYRLRSHNSTRGNLRSYPFSLSQSSKLTTLVISPEYQSAMESVIRCIEEAGSQHSSAPRVVVCGDKNLGKSTLLAFVINSVLNICEEVFHLEGDPGQAEFTPPGCVSLTRVQKPILGPNFTHERTPNISCFVGGSNVQNLPQFYSSSVKKLVQSYEQHGLGFPLFVNTMGWNTGIGLSLLVDVIRMVKPTHVIQLMRHAQSPTKGYKMTNMTPKNVLSSCGWSTSLKPEEPEMSFEYIPIVSPVSAGRLGSKVPAPMKRTRMLLSYLGRLQLEGSPSIPINSFKPYRVPWSSVALHVCHEYVLPNQVIHAMNGSWVALCQIPAAVMQDGTEADDYKTLSVMPPNVCYGFGVIRAIDVTQKYLYIITPEPLHRLRKVNALLRGDANLPDELLTSQVGAMPAPYIANVLPRKRDDPTEPIRGRIFR